MLYKWKFNIEHALELVVVLDAQHIFSRARSLGVRRRRRRGRSRRRLRRLDATEKRTHPINHSGYYKRDWFGHTALPLRLCALALLLSRRRLGILTLCACVCVFFKLYFVSVF